jgi:chromosome segregation ATPase
VSSHVLKLWPFVLKRTLLQERAAGDYTFEQAVAVIARVRADLATARRQRLESLEQLNELRVDVHDLTVERDQLQGVVSVNAESMSRLQAEKGTLKKQVEELKSEIEANSIDNWRKATAEILQLRADLKSAADTIVRLKGLAA